MIPEHMKLIICVAVSVIPEADLINLTTNSLFEAVGGGIEYLIGYRYPGIRSHSSPCTTIAYQHI